MRSEQTTEQFEALEKMQEQRRREGWAKGARVKPYVRCEWLFAVQLQVINAKLARLYG